MNVPVLDSTRRWQCPSCDATHVTKTPAVITPLHPCRGQKGLSVPYVEVVKGTELRKNSTRHVAVERGDYIGDESGVVHDGDRRAVMAVRTEREDGSYDCHVFAPVATATAHI